MLSLICGFAVKYRNKKDENMGSPVICGGTGGAALQRHCQEKRRVGRWEVCTCAGKRSGKRHFLMLGSSEATGKAISLWHHEVFRAVRRYPRLPWGLGGSLLLKVHKH